MTKNVGKLIFEILENHTDIVCNASFAGRMFYKMIQKNMAKQFGGGNSEGMGEFTKIIDGIWLCFAKTVSIKCLDRKELFDTCISFSL